MSAHQHHSHHHTHKTDTAPLNKAFAIAIVLNSAYIFAEILYAFSSHSMSLLADATHNFGDVLGLLLAWMANWLLILPAKKRYSYGFKRFSIMAAFANAGILIATSALIAYHAIEKLWQNTAINENTVIVIGLIGIVVNAGSSLLFMKSAHHDINIKGAFLHLLFDALILAGVVIGAIMIKFTGLHWIDPLLGLLIVGIILWGTWGLLRDSLNLMLDAIPHTIDHIGVKNYLSELPDVKAIHDLHIWGLSTREVALTVHLVIPNKPLTDADYHEINTTLREKFNIHHATIQVEMGTDNALCHRSEVC